MWRGTTMVVKKCEFCCASFKVPLYRQKTAKFCSKKCKSLSERKRKVINCQYCGKSFETNKKDRKFCNVKCHRKIHSGTNHPKYYVDSSS